MQRAWDVGTSWAATLLRGAPSGLRVGPLGARPAQPLELYEYEACPFCRKVREALSMLDLDAHIHPCPRNGQRYRPEVVRAGGRAQFPYLRDPNTGRSMYESDEIIAYLYEHYGRGAPARALRLGPLTALGASLTSAVRIDRGRSARPSTPAPEPLELWSFQASPYCRLVREVLCELELTYLLHNVAKGSPRRDAFLKRSGKLQVPYLYDPNTQRALFESDAIVRYLHASYGART